MYVESFHVRQKLTLMVNRYQVLASNPDGTEGALLAFAEQKRMKLKEEVYFFADESKNQPVFSFKARQRLDMRAEHDVFDASGAPLGYFRKDFGASLFRSTWHLSTPNGVDATGRERRLSIAILRRIWSYIPYLGDLWVPFVFHFDFANNFGDQLVMTSERRMSIGDRYTITVPDPRLDFRVAAAMAVALDALQSR
jgi:uncharacterized protein YxjI